MRLLSLCSEAPMALQLTVSFVLPYKNASALLLLLLYDMYVFCHRHFFLVLRLNQRWSPPLRLQASHCSTFRIMCDVPSIAVFCSESIECFPGIVSKFFLKLLFTIPVAPIITGTIVHFRFHIRYISIHKLLYFNFFSASFCTTFLSAGIATSISVHVLSFNNNNTLSKLGTGIALLVYWLGYEMDKPGFEFRQGQNAFLFSSTSRSTPKPTHPLVQ